MTGTGVAQAPAADAAEIVETLADAFADDPVLTWLMPSSRRAERLAAHLRRPLS